MIIYKNKLKLVKNFIGALIVFITAVTGFNAYALTYEFKNSWEAEGTFGGNENFDELDPVEATPISQAPGGGNDIGFDATGIIKVGGSINSGINNLMLFDGMDDGQQQDPVGYGCVFQPTVAADGMLGWRSQWSIEAIPALFTQMSTQGLIYLPQVEDGYACIGGDPNPPNENSEGFDLAIVTNTQSISPENRMTIKGTVKGKSLRVNVRMKDDDSGFLGEYSNAHDHLRLTDENGNEYWASKVSEGMLEDYDGVEKYSYSFLNLPCVNFSSFSSFGEGDPDRANTNLMFCEDDTIGNGQTCYTEDPPIQLLSSTISVGQDLPLFSMQSVDIIPCVQGSGDKGSPVPPMYMFAAPSLPPVIMVMKGSSKNSVNFGNSGFAPLGNGLIVGVGYDDATNDYDDASSGENNQNFDGHDYRIHLDFIKGINERLFWGIAGEYRHQEYNIYDTVSNKFKADYYGPRVDVGWRGQNSFVQLSGTYLWGNVKFRNGGGNNTTTTWNKSSNAWMAQVGLLGEWDKYFTRHLSLDLGVNAQYVFQHLDTINFIHNSNPETVKYDDVNYGKVDLNLGLGIDFYRGWYVVPNVGYRWYTDDYVLKGVFTGGAANEWKYNMPSGIRYGVRGGKSMIMTGSKWDQLALTAYWDYFKKSDLKQSVWGVLAQYPF